MSSSDRESEATVAELTRAVKGFASARDWGQFHDPKNLAMALASEVGELTSILRWVRGDKSDAFVGQEHNRDDLKDEIGDIGICLLLLCARVDIDLASAVTDKLRKNAVKYPLGACRGRADPP
jgi:dCTP diphosphatase